MGIYLNNVKKLTFIHMHTNKKIQNHFKKQPNKEKKKQHKNIKNKSIDYLKRAIKIF